MYLREASRFLDVKVFKAILRLGTSNKPPQTVYFCQYVQIGMSVYT
jgi:hypothetical protein